MSRSLERTVQLALLGEVPPTLRFLYVGPDSEELSFHAVFSSEATDEHLESAEVVFTEILASCPYEIKGQVTIEKNDEIPWKKGEGEHLMYLRWGELNDT